MRGRLGVTAAIVMLLAAPPAAAAGEARVRVVHAIPGAPAVTVSVGGKRTSAGLAFGEATPYATAAGGRVRIELARGGAPVVAGSERLASGGRYTFVAVEDGERRLLALRDGRARAGRARLRVVQAAPELGKADVRLGARTLGQGLAFAGSTGYATVEPGTYPLAATPAGRGGAALARAGAVPLAAGTSSTALLVGTRGETTRFVVLEDAAFAPRAAPDTGLGGLARRDGPRWPLLLLLGAAAAVAARRRGARPAAALAMAALPLAAALPGATEPPPGPVPALARLPSLTPATDLPAGAPALRPAVARPGSAGLRPVALEPLSGGVRPAAPARIAIPAAGVDAAVEPVSTSRSGVEVPPVGRAGWLAAGPRPGEPGRAVVIGHLDSANGPGLFARVPRIPPGTPVEVTDDLGRVRRFNVIGSAQVEKARFPSEAVYGGSPRPVLVLITCGGPWDAGAGYRDNVLVYAQAA
jgi:hypothetical protein